MQVAALCDVAESTDNLVTPTLRGGLPKADSAVSVTFEIGTKRQDGKTQHFRRRLQTQGVFI